MSAQLCDEKMSRLVTIVHYFLQFVTSIDRFFSPSLRWSRVLESLGRTALVLIPFTALQMIQKAIVMDLMRILLKTENAIFFYQIQKKRIFSQCAVSWLI